MQNKTTSCVYTNKIAKRQQIIAEMLYICKFIFCYAVMTNKTTML